MFDDDPLSSGLVQCKVEDELRVIPMAILQEVFDELAAIAPKVYAAKTSTIRSVRHCRKGEVLGAPRSTRH